MKFKIGDRVICVQSDLQLEFLHLSGKVIRMSDSRLVVEFDRFIDRTKVWSIPADLMEIEQEYLNTQEMKKLLGVN